MSKQPSRADRGRRASGPAPSAGPPIFLIAVVALVVVAVAVVVVVQLVGDSDGAQGRAFGPVKITGDALAPLLDPGADPSVGQPAPVIEGETPSGTPVTIDPAEDGPMVIVFVAHWCPHCQSEVPRIVEVVDDSGRLDGVKVAVVATSSDPERENFPAGKWLDDEGWPGPVLLDDESSKAAIAYGVPSFPFLVVVDKDGNVVYRTAGEQGDDRLREIFGSARSGEAPA